MTARPTLATVSRIDFGGVRLLSDQDDEIGASVAARLRDARKALGNASIRD